MNIAFIGLGVMGFPMAGHLQTATQSWQMVNRYETMLVRLQKVNA